MAIGKMITRKPVTVAPDDSLAKAAKLMEQENVGAVVVTERGKPTGIVTDRDLALATCVRGVSRDDAVVAVMTHPVSTIREDEGVLDATRQMMEQSVRRLPIVDQYEHLVALVSADDIVPLLSRELHNIVEGIQAEVAQ
jgi:signal-transduction protein with cAMP-binding, CBS, and nucleotidyltransferase domain